MVLIPPMTVTLFTDDVDMDDVEGAILIIRELGIGLVLVI